LATVPAIWLCVSWRCQPSSKVKGTWTFSFARHLGQEVQDDAA